MLFYQKRQQLVLPAPVGLRDRQHWVTCAVPLASDSMEAQDVRYPTLRTFNSAAISVLCYVQSSYGSLSNILSTITSCIAPIDQANKQLSTPAHLASTHIMASWNIIGNRESILESTLYFLPNVDANGVAGRDGGLEGPISTNFNRYSLACAVDLSSADDIAICPCWK